MASLKAGMVRRGLTTIKTKSETIAQAYDRGFGVGYNACIEQNKLNIRKI
jgi:hypothetical protein